MKKGYLFVPALFAATVAFLIWACAACSRPKPEVMVRIHFAGAELISKDTNSMFFKTEFGSPEALALESQTLDKLARAPGVWLKSKLPTGADDGSGRLRPLLDDFLRSEWIFEMREAPASPEYALAIRLDAGRAQLWQTNLRQQAEAWTKISARDIPNGWELKKDQPPDLLRAVRAGNWLVIGCGQDALPLSDAWAGGNLPEAETNWLNANVDWPRLAKIFPALAKIDFPAIQMQVAGTGSNLFVTGQLDLSRPLPSLDQWQVPVSLIHQPLTSFTAVRGFAPWLEDQSWARRFELAPEPDQLFCWSLGLMPLQTFIAVPVSNATNALAELGQNLAANTNWQKHLLSAFALERAPYRVSLQNVPFAAPEVLALDETDGEFLFADVFPNLPRGQAPPAELLRALNRDNLVFYHWEYTAARLKDLPQLTQLGLLLTRHQQLQADTAAAKWLNRLGPSLGNCVTEVTQTGPTELTFKRQGQAGLTAPELIALANWLEAPNFPGCDLSLPPAMHFRNFHRPINPHRPVKILTAPAPARPAKD